jgi:hypothetical protein
MVPVPILVRPVLPVPPLVLSAILPFWPLPPVGQTLLPMLAEPTVRMERVPSRLLAKTPPFPLRPPVVWLVPLKSIRSCVRSPLLMMVPLGELVRGSAVTICLPHLPRLVKERVPPPMRVNPV